MSNGRRLFIYLLLNDTRAIDHKPTPIAVAMPNYAAKRTLWSAADKRMLFLVNGTCCFLGGSLSEK